MQAATAQLITVPKSKYEALENEVAYLRQQLTDIRRMLYGRKSERFIPSDSDQLGLFAVQSPTSPLTEEKQQINYERSVVEKQKPVRQLLPAHLPRVEEIIDPAEKEENSQKIGEEVTEILEYDPGHLFVRRIVRPKYKINGEIKIADLPKLPIPKGNASASLLAHIQVSKWIDHLPYYRQRQIFRRGGVELSQSTINTWFKATAELLAPLYEKLVQQVQQAFYLQADESPIKVMDEQKKGKKQIRYGYHWVYHAPEERLVVFDYRPTRSRNGPQQFLQDFSGNLQTDGYQAYNNLNLEQLACMAHARRYFEKALDNDKARASYALSLIKQLYAIERSVKEVLSVNEIKQLRQSQALPILADLKQHLDKWLNEVRPKSNIGKAVQYSLKLWDRLIYYTKNGHYHIDNNAIENTIRPLALGRKNYLFAGSNQGAKRAAMMYSFFATCKLHGIQPYSWLKDVLERIPEHKVNKIDELLPHKWKPLT